MTEPIQVLLADDHPVVRTGIGTILAAVPDVQLVGEAADGYETQRLCRELQPDVLLLDLSMPGPSPVDTVAYLHGCCPEVKVLVLSAFDDDAYVHGLTEAGVAGYLLKDEATASVVRAIRTVAQGATWYSRSIAEKLFHRPYEEGNEGASLHLTERERSLLALIAQGWDNARIATDLGLAEQTVANYVSRLYKKLNVNTRAEAVVWTREHGFGEA